MNLQHVQGAEIAKNTNRLAMGRLFGTQDEDLKYLKPLTSGGQSQAASSLSNMEKNRPLKVEKVDGNYFSRRWLSQ